MPTTNVTPILHWTPERHIGRSGSHVTLRFDREAAEHAAEVYRWLAQLCLRSSVTRLLVVVTDGGADGELALRNALTTMILSGIAPAFRLALVVATERGEWRYRTAQRDLCAAQVDARIFDTSEQALRWLDTQPAQARA